MRLPSILDTILAKKREEVVQLQQQYNPQQWRELAQQAITPRGFAIAMQQKINAKRPAVIAEIKKASPSQGVIRPDFDVPAIARAYEQAGATCLSVLTDENFFQGSKQYLRQAHTASQLPLLRKDFIIDPVQIFEARAFHADAILLIVAALSDAQLEELHACANELNMDVLLEVHDAKELQRALTIDSPLLGINNRNLHDFTTTLDTTIELLSKIPSNKLVITESGIHTRDDVEKMLAQGVYGFLVGESLMREPQCGDKLRALFPTCLG